MSLHNTPFKVEEIDATLKSVSDQNTIQNTIQNETPYIVERTLGSGATASVYLARSRDRDEHVALKVIHPHLSASIRPRLHAEHQALKRLTHGNAVSIIDLIETDRLLMLVLEYCNGPSLNDLEKQLPLLLPEIAVKIVCGALQGLAHAHAQKVVHRDIKPSNILIDFKGQQCTPKISDFGLATLDDLSLHTLTGALIGSPDFMAPEQAQGESASVQSDIFSMGSVLYYLCTKSLPFHRNSIFGTITAVAKEPLKPAHLVNAAVSPALSRIIQKALEKNPADRYQSADEFLQALESYLNRINLDHVDLYNWYQNTNAYTRLLLEQHSQQIPQILFKNFAPKTQTEGLLWLSYFSAIAPQSEAIGLLTEQVLQLPNTVDAGAEENRSVFWYSRKHQAGLAIILFLIASATTLAFWNYRLVETPNTATRLITPPETTKVSAADETTNFNKSLEKAPVPSPDTYDNSNIEKPINKPTSSQSPMKPATTKIPSAKSDSSSNWVHIKLPDHVKVLWDGRVVPSQTDFRANIGPHKLTLVVPGQKTITQVVEVEASEPTYINAR